MTEPDDLFMFAEKYPDGPGYTNETTSKAAAEKVAPKAGTQAADCLEFIRQRGRATPDEASIALNMLVTSARPRFTQLKNLGLIVEDGTAINENGNDSIAYKLAPPETPTLIGKGRAVREREAICKWLRERAAAGWSVDLHVAAGMIEAGNHLQ